MTKEIHWKGKNTELKTEILRNEWCTMLNRIVVDERSAARKVS
jgi:hypothetical protein